MFWAIIFMFHSTWWHFQMLELWKFVWHSSFDKKSNTTNKQPIHVQRQKQQQLRNSTVFTMHNMQFSWLDFRRIFFKLRIVIFETWKR